MANNFNFQASLKLNSTGFRKGVSQVKSSLAGLKTSFLQVAGALGAGLGFTQLIGNLKTTATELSVAMNTLKNVSYQTKYFKDEMGETSVEVSNFEDNLAFVKKLSNDYAQDLVAITENYAKFTAACKKTALALDDQRMIFDSLTRAAAYYHLSADRTSDMMNAVTQMMSKGKVTAEELRRQLGNTLPGAFNMMAAAMDKSTAQLDKLMRDGKVVAADVLPKFAAMLNSVTSTAEFDSLQSSMNRLKNSWYDLVQKSGAEGLFKDIIDGSTDALTWTTDNIKGIKSVIVGLVTYLATTNIWRGWIRYTDSWLNHLKTNLEIAQQEMRSYHNKFRVLENKGVITPNEGGIKKTYKLDSAYKSEDSLGFRRAQIALEQYHNQIIKVSEAELELKIIDKETFESIKKEVLEANSKLGAMASTIDNGTQSVGRMGAAFQKAGDSFKNFIKANWIFMVIAAITSIVSYVRKVREETERINSIARNYANESDRVKHTKDEEASTLLNNLKIVKDTNQAESARLYALNEINKAMGRVGDKAFQLSELDNVKGKYEEITEEVYKWIDATKKQALVQHYASQIAEITAKKREAERKREAAWNYWMEAEATGDYNVKDLYEAKTAYEKLGKEIKQYNQALTTAEEDMLAAGVAVAAFFSKIEEQDAALEKLDEAKTDYNDTLLALERQLREGAITQEEFNKEVHNLTKKTYQDAAATGKFSIEKILDKEKNGQTLTALEKWYLELKEKVLQTAQEVIFDELASSLIKDIDEALAEEAKELEKEFEKILENDEKRRQIDIDYAGATSELKYENSRNKRDGTFDYKKSRADIFGEEADIANENLDRVMDKIQDLLDEEQKLLKETGKGLDDVARQELESLRKYYRELSKNAKTIEEAYRFEQIRQDIEDFEKEMTSGVFSGIENFATSLDRVVTGAQQLRDIMENVDSTGWEKMMGIVNYFFNILNAITSVIETVNTLTEISNMLAGAKSLLDDKKKADAAIELEGTVAQVAAEETLAAVKAKEAAFETTITANKVAQAEASLGVATALGVETAAWIALAAAMKDAAIAAAAANAAAVAGPGAPAAALAAAASVGAGLTATMAAFAKGGIVGGNSTRGDRNLARVNSGEMILNKAQQGTLFNMLNGKGGFGGNVQFKIHGADLVGTINNYNSRKRG